MPRYALIKEGRVAEVRTYPAPLEGREIKRVGGNPVLRLIRENMPPHDPLTQNLTGPELQIRGNDVLETYTTTDVVPQEARRRKRVAVDEARAAQIGHLIEPISAFAAALKALSQSLPVPTEAAAAIDRVLRAVADNPDA